MRRERTPDAALVAASQALYGLFESGELALNVLESATDESLAGAVAKVDAFFRAVETTGAVTS